MECFFGSKRAAQSHRMFIPAIGDNSPGPSLAREIDKARMAFEHKRPVEVQIPKRAVDARFLFAEPRRQMPVGDRDDLIDVGIVPNHIKSRGRAKKNKVALGKGPANGANQRRGHQRVANGARANNQDSRPAVLPRV